MTCPSMAGVTTTFIGRRRGPSRPPPQESALIPGRRREPKLDPGGVVWPHVVLLLALPLERHHLVRELEAVLVDLVVAEHGPHLELQELLAYLVGVERVRALHGLGVNHAAGVPGRGV